MQNDLSPRLEARRTGGETLRMTPVLKLQSNSLPFFPSAPPLLCVQNLSIITQKLMDSKKTKR